MPGRSPQDRQIEVDADGGGRKPIDRRQLTTHGRPPAGNAGICSRVPAHICPPLSPSMSLRSRETGFVGFNKVKLSTAGLVQCMVRLQRGMMAATAEVGFATSTEPHRNLRESSGECCSRNWASPAEFPEDVAPPTAHSVLRLPQNEAPATQADVRDGQRGWRARLLTAMLVGLTHHWPGSGKCPVLCRLDATCCFGNRPLFST